MKEFRYRREGSLGVGGFFYIWFFLYFIIRRYKEEIGEGCFRGEGKEGGR